MTTNTASSVPLTDEIDGEDTLPIMVHVTAPASLPAGYTFEAEINGDPDKVFTCDVPGGGVEEGQVFLAPLPRTFNGERLKAPTGQWKDGLCDFANAPGAGVCHASLWCSLCCTQIAMAQIMSRMQLSWLGEPSTLYHTRKTFTVVLTIVVSYFVYACALELATLPYAEGQAPPAMAGFRLLGNLLFALWALYALCRTRANVRARYQIPEGERCAGCEDICCSLWCSCCVAAQMLRHTGQYEVYPGTCCTKTGHPAGTPLVV